jgi:hypothetical protein
LCCCSLCACSRSSCTSCCASSSLPYFPARTRCP